MKWLQIHITVDQEHVDFTETLLLSLGAVSVTLDDAEDQALLEPLPGETPLWNKVIVTGIYQEDEQDPIDVAKLEAFLSAQLPNAPMRHEQLEDQVWERAWMDYYDPIQISDKFWIVPEWLEAPDADAVNIKLDPGLAFGTGNHASTFLCLQWLGQTDLKDKTIRLVEVHTQYHAKLQIARYSSGMHFATPKSQFDADARRYPDLYSLTQTRVYYRRHDFDFKLVPEWDEGVDELLKAVQEAQKMDDVVSLETKSGGLTYELVVHAAPERFAIVVKFIDDAYNATAAKNKES